MRFKVLPKEVIDLLTESQSQIHLAEPWFHRGLSRDVAQKILATHNVDGYVAGFKISEGCVNVALLTEPFVRKFVYGNLVQKTKRTLNQTKKSRCFLPFVLCTESLSSIDYSISCLVRT